MRYPAAWASPTRQSSSARKSALDSRSCSLFCPGAAVDTAELHDKIGKAQKMHKFNEFGVFSPPSRRGGTRAEPLQSSCGAHARERTRTACRAIYEVSGRTRTHLDGFGMQQLPRLCAASLSSSGNQLANSPSGVRSEAVRQHRARFSPRYGMGVAVFSAMRVDEPSAQLGQEEAE